MSEAGTALLQADGIGKSFGAIRALDDVSLSVATGEVHGLLGANGAGKSTLIGVLSGAVQPDSGRLRVAGRDVRLGSLADARRAGLAVVHQELMLFPDRTVEENIFASVLPTAPFRVVGRRGRRQKVEAAMHRLAAAVDLRARVGDLPLSHRQLVEIARALCRGGTVLVLDEPTSALDAEREFEIFQRFRDLTEGKIAVLISHRFSTVRMADRIAVIEDGQISELGSHAELLALGGTYSRLFEMQAAGYR
jgi:ABC-type sugar transport system ATPase subunit